MGVKRRIRSELVLDPPPTTPLRRPDKNPCGDLVPEQHHVEVTTWHRFLISMWCEDEIPRGDWGYRVLHRTTQGVRCRFTFRHQEHAVLFKLTWC